MNKISLLCLLLTLLVFHACVNKNNSQKINKLDSLFVSKVTKEYVLSPKWVDAIYYDEKLNKEIDTLILIANEIDSTFGINKIWRYKTILTDEENNTIASSINSFKLTGKRWEYSPNQREIVYKDSLIFSDENKLRIMYNNLNLSYPKRKNWITYSFSGIMENDSEIFLHPFRSNYLRVLEYAPFPKVKLPLYQNGSWNSSLTLGSGWSDFENMTVHSYYTIKNKANFSSKRFKDIDVWNIHATSNSKFGNCILNSKFSDKIGFIEFKYSLPKGYKIHFELKEIIVL